MCSGEAGVTSFQNPPIERVDIMFNEVFEDKKVLVTGHTGFKGSWLTLWLLELGARVVGVSDDVPTIPSHYATAGLGSLVQEYWLDIRNASELARVFEKERPDFVFHLAAQALVSLSYEDPLKTYSTNAIGSANVLEAIRRASCNCTVVMITSDKCYENVETYYGYREDDPLGGRDPYSASKAAAEIIASSYIRSFFTDSDHAVHAARARAGNVVGGGDWAKDRLIPDIIRAWQAQQPVIIRRPASTRPWQHVLEPLSGYLWLAANLATNDRLHGEAFNFGPDGGEIYPVADVCRLLETHLPGLAIHIDETSGSFEEAGLLKLCCDKAKSYLDWNPVMTFEETMALTAEWYRRHVADPEGNIVAKTREQIRHYCELATQRHHPWVATRTNASNQWKESALLP